MEDSGEPLRNPWPSSAAPLLLRAGMPGSPLELWLLLGLMLSPSRAKALASKRSLQEKNILMPTFQRDALIPDIPWNSDNHLQRLHMSAPDVTETLACDQHAFKLAQNRRCSLKGNKTHP